MQAFNTKGKLKEKNRTPEMHIYRFGHGIHRTRSNFFIDKTVNSEQQARRFDLTEKYENTCFSQ